MLTVLKYERKEKIMNELKKYRNMIVYIIVMILGYSIDIFICYICDINDVIYENLINAIVLVIAWKISYLLYHQCVMEEDEALSIVEMNWGNVISIIGIILLNIILIKYVPNYISLVIAPITYFIGSYIPIQSIQQNNTFKAIKGELKKSFTPCNIKVVILGSIFMVLFIIFIVVLETKITYTRFESIFAIVYILIFFLVIIKKRFK